MPWHLLGELVRVVVCGGRISIQHEGKEVAVHPESAGRRQRLNEPAHFAGISRVPALAQPAALPSGPPDPALLRPLREYELLVGGGW
ncbi:MAG: hypothetical protein EOS71_28045 [Mesorhizobium sp.]|nr:MAG: hypothetical protein EOS71_28045 [Mesorhizobium sp.]